MDPSDLESNLAADSLVRSPREAVPDDPAEQRSEPEADRDEQQDVEGRHESMDDDQAVVALYCRVSTDEQSLARQRQLTSEYALERLGVPLSAIELYFDKQTGTNTDRAGYRRLMEDVENGEVDRVIVSEVSRISRSVRDFSATVHHLVDEHGVALHVLDMGIDIDPAERDPYTRAFLQVAATFAELEAEIKRQNTREGMAAARDQGKWTGRPPFGFDVGAEGYLSPNDDYETALVIIDELDKGVSKNQLARRAGISRMTIRRIDENRDRYVRSGDDGRTVEE